MKHTNHFDFKKTHLKNPVNHRIFLWTIEKSEEEDEREMLYGGSAFTTSIEQTHANIEQTHESNGKA
jgi:hypothetical protein